MNTAMGPPPGLGFPPGIPINYPTAVTHLRGSDIHVEASRLNALPNSEYYSFVAGKVSQVKVPSAVLSVRKYYQRP